MLWLAWAAVDSGYGHLADTYTTLPPASASWAPTGMLSRQGVPPVSIVPRRRSFLPTTGNKDHLKNYSETNVCKCIINKEAQQAAGADSQSRRPRCCCAPRTHNSGARLKKTGK